MQVEVFQLGDGGGGGTCMGTTLL
eukprot:COSAG02_NODE_6828_length_3340_cov_1.871027_1_plen_23_part_10